MSLPRVLVSSPIHEKGVELLREHFEVIIHNHEYGVEDRRMFDLMANVDAVVTRSLRVDSAMLAKADRLKAIVKHGSGLNTIDVDKATELGIVVASTGGANSGGVAEATVGLLLALLRGVINADHIVRSGGFKHRTMIPPAGEIEGSTMLLIGFGHIARKVAQICGSGFGAHIIAYDPLVSDSVMTEHGVVPAKNLMQALSEADIVSLHVPLLPQTEGLLGKEQLSVMKKSALIINTARGGIIDENALAHSLISGRIGGAAIDVFSTEPPDLTHPLFTAPNVIFSPHLGGVTKSAACQTALEAAHAVIAVLSGKKPTHLANPEVWVRRRGASCHG